MKKKILIIVLLFQTHVWAGIFVSPSLKWVNMSFRPLDEEPTLNYYAYGYGLNLGYSFDQFCDITAVGHYFPGNLHEPKFPLETRPFIFYGGELGFRFLDTIYLGGRVGGTWLQQVTKTVDEELGGEWRGLGAGGSLGAYFKVNRDAFTQVSFDLFTVNSFLRQDEPVGDKRKFDVFSLSIAYIFSSYQNSGIENTLFKGFLDNFSL